MKSPISFSPKIRKFKKRSKPPSARPTDLNCATSSSAIYKSERRSSRFSIHRFSQRFAYDTAEKFRKKTPLPKAVIVVIPLLYETSGQVRILEQVLVVLCKEELQLQRLMLRDGTRKDLAKQMIAAQMPNNEKARRAQFVIRNDGDKAALLKAVDDLIPKLTF